MGMTDSLDSLESCNILLNIGQDSMHLYSHEKLNPIAVNRISGVYNSPALRFSLGDVDLFVKFGPVS